jgi:hypothetical protein
MGGRTTTHFLSILASLHYLDAGRGLTQYLVKICLPLRDNIFGLKCTVSSKNVGRRSNLGKHEQSAICILRAYIYSCEILRKWAISVIIR